MIDVIIELCKNRKDAETRKRAIRAANPHQEYDSRIIEDVASASLTELPSAIAGAALGSSFRAYAPGDTGALLFIWPTIDDD